MDSKFKRTLAAYVAVCALLAAAVFGAAAPSARASSSTGYAAGSFTVRLTSSPDQSFPCFPKLNLYDRTETCWSQEGSITALDSNGAYQGKTVFTTVQTIVLSLKKRTFYETFFISRVTVSGHPPSWKIKFSVFCGSPCKATNNFPQGSRLATGTGGGITYSDSIGEGKVHSTKSAYEMVFSATGYKGPGPDKWKSPQAYRCDDALKGQGAGCVFPAFAPTMTSMTKLTEIAKNIRTIQTRGPGHYGRPGSGNPLHRLADTAKAGANYRAVCSRQVQGPPPSSGESCDEYPFKSTYEGGTSLSAKNRGTAWVPTKEQNQQGAYVKNFYYADRVLDHDAFWVKV